MWCRPAIASPEDTEEGREPDADGGDAEFLSQLHDHARANVVES
jgi:hypothetical protein